MGLMGLMGFKWIQISCHAERVEAGFEEFQEVQEVSRGFWGYARRNDDATWF
jgi:hypothetical protein